MLLYPIGSTPACRHAAALLKEAGVPLTDHPTPEITHLLLDVPSFSPDGRLRGGEPLMPLLQMLPPQVVIFGGNLNVPALSQHAAADLLQDPVYLAKNAAITAQCALRLGLAAIETTFDATPVLVIGWGRIAICLSQLLKALGFPVTAAARDPSQRAMAMALGCDAIGLSQIPEQLPRMGLVFNTVPAPVLSRLPSPCCPVFDLASAPGLDGLDVVTARGLPGAMAAKASGALIAGTVLRYLEAP